MLSSIGGEISPPPRGRRGSLGRPKPGVGAHGEGEGVLRGQAVAAADASALHVVGGDVCGHELVLHISVPESCEFDIITCHAPGVDRTVLGHRR